VLDAQLGNRDVWWLSPGREPSVGPRADTCSPAEAGERPHKGQSLAPQISETLETGASIGKDRSLPETADGQKSAALLERSLTRRPDLATPFDARRHNDQFVPFRCSRGSTHRRPSPRAWYRLLSPENSVSRRCSPTQPLAETSSGAAHEGRRPTRGRASSRGPRAPACGGQVASEEARCVQDLWRQVALLASEQWIESSDESKLPRRVMLQPIRRACEISAKTGVDCLKVEP